MKSGKKRIVTNLILFVFVFVTDGSSDLVPLFTYLM